MAATPLPLEAMRSPSHSPAGTRRCSRRTRWSRWSPTASGTDSLAGPVELSVRVGVSGGEVTSLVCAAESRHVIVHLGDGLDRAVAAADRAAPGEVVGGRRRSRPRWSADHPAGDLPAWAAAHPAPGHRLTGRRRVAAARRAPADHDGVPLDPRHRHRGAGGVRGRRHRPGRPDGRRRAAVHGRRQGHPADRGVRRPRRPSRRRRPGGACRRAAARGDRRPVRRRRLHRAGVHRGLRRRDAALRQRAGRLDQPRRPADGGGAHRARR